MREVTLAELPGLVGQEIGVSDWLEINQERVNRFADATGDHQWIHVDVERATKELGGPIAHGYLLISLIPFLSRNIVDYKDMARGLNYGVNKVRFTSPVAIGAKIRMRLKVLKCDMRAGGYVVTWEHVIEIEDETRAACVAETMAILYAAA